MAIRYSGDVEIRMAYDKGVYRIRFKRAASDKSWTCGTLLPRECLLSPKEPRNSPEAYDKVARRVVGFLRAKGFQTGELRRVFQAPCPVPRGSR